MTWKTFARIVRSISIWGPLPCLRLYRLSCGLEFAAITTTRHLEPDTKTASAAGQCFAVRFQRTIALEWTCVAPGPYRFLFYMCRREPRSSERVVHVRMPPRAGCERTSHLSPQNARTDLCQRRSGTKDLFLRQSGRYDSSIA